MSLTRDLRIMAGQSLGLGVGIGEVYFLVTAKTSADANYSYLREKYVPEGKIYTSLTEAYDATTAGRNDTIFAFPGTHTQAAKITWAKSSTHLIGVGSANQRIPATAGTTGCVYFPCTTAMTELFLITGHHVVMKGFSTYLSTATGEADIKVNGRNVTLDGLFMKGGQNSTQLASAVLGYGLWVDGSVAGYGNALTVKDCHIGDPRNTVRTDGGMIYMIGNSVGNNSAAVEFKNCVVAGWCETAGISAVYQSGNYAAACYTLWEDCTFYNFYTNLGSILTAGVFNDTCNTTHMNLLTGRTCQYGWNVWGNNDGFMFGQMPIPAVNGGKMLTMTG